ncbi:hypothetical protein M413DRAFT_448739 [Hebeloma cylindrosporum]|uniref:Uncharacterized protein n=1 Tax=Hebeloma cylindrosporum TaxID=76867 RepID=A0A0C3BZY3_HEBCY|nr:hypothetical protein M413DRAFT_448739 [Hebeloma cylindrosporum h7]
MAPDAMCWFSNSSPLWMISERCKFPSPTETETKVPPLINVFVALAHHDTPEVAIFVVSEDPMFIIGYR